MQVKTVTALKSSSLASLNTEHFLYSDTFCCIADQYNEAGLLNIAIGYTFGESLGPVRDKQLALAALVLET